jgi:hypothetical protein
LPTPCRADTWSASDSARPPRASRSPRPPSTPDPPSSRSPSSSAPPGLALHVVAAFSYPPHVAPGANALVAGNARLGPTRALITAAVPPAAATAIALGAPAPFALAALLAALAPS